MKGLLKSVFLCVSIYGISSFNSDDLSGIDQYIQRKSVDLQETLSQQKHLLFERNSKNNMKIETSILLEQNIKDVKLFTLYDAIYFRMGKNIFKIKHSGENLALKRIGQLNEFPENEQVLFMKTIEFEGRCMILTRFEVEEAHIYGLLGDDTFFIQTLLIPHSTDADFFVHNKKLYLIVTTNQGDNLIATSLYKWLGSHFDEIQTMFTTGAIKVTTFSSETSEIIIILRQLPNRTMFSEVFEFRNDEMKKIQIIETKNPIKADVFSSGNKTHVIIYDQTKNNAIYQWNGFQLIKVNEFETQNDVTLSQISTVNGKSLLMISSNDTLHVYPLSTKKKIIEDKKFRMSTFLKVLDLHNNVNGSSILSFIVGLSQDHNITISLVHTVVNFSESEIIHDGTEVLKKCFNDLETKVYEFRKTIAQSELKEYYDSSQNDKEIDGILGESLTLDSKVDIEISQLQDRLEHISSYLESYTLLNRSNIIVNGSLAIKGDTSCTRMDAGNIVVELLNEFQFAPVQWLRYKESQTITGPVVLEHAVTDRLEISPEDALLKDITLRSEGKLIIPEEILLDSLIADKAYTGSINGIPVDEMYLRSSRQPVEGIKTFDNLEVNDIEIKSINGEKSNGILSIISNNKLQDSNVHINVLQVETINDINWSEFWNSVFRAGSSSPLTGPLIFTEFKTEHLKIPKLNENAVEDFLTKTTNQTIDSNIIFNRIFAENIAINSVNGIDLSKSAVHYGMNDSIGPVTIDKLNVENDLKLTGKVDISLFLKNGNRILGTNESDLLQQYERTVKIKGNLHLKNLTLQPDARIFLNETEIEADIQKIYWTKSTYQQIPTNINIQGIYTPHVLTSILNGDRFSQYMINTDTDTLETEYNFENVIVNGNVSLGNTKIHDPDLDKLVKEAIRTNGSYIINGRKIYLDTLRMEHLATTRLEEINTLDVLNTRWPTNVTGSKIFKDMVVEGDITSTFNYVSYIDNVDIENFENDIIYIDQGQDIDTLNVDNLNVTNLLVQTLNGHSIGDYMDTVKKFESLNKLKDLELNGNIMIHNIMNISKVNEIPLESLLNRAPRKGSYGGFEGNVRFLEKVKIGNLVTVYINNQNMKYMTRRLLLKNLNQTISAPYSFGNMKAGNIITPKINDKTVSNLLEVSSKQPQEIDLHGQVAFKSDVNVRSLKAYNMIPCNTKKVFEELLDPSSREWLRIRILGNVKLLDDQNNLYRILENAVTLNSTNTIRAPVEFLDHISAEEITFEKLLNNMNISETLEDSVLFESETEQIITGQKWFSSLRTKEAIVTKDSNISNINDENMKFLNDDIIDKETIDQIVIRGKKTFFGGLQTNRINIETLPNSDLENIVNLDGLKKISSAIFDFLEIDNDLNVSSINDVDFNNVLSRRLLCKSTDNQSADGIYYFHNIDVDDLTTISINGIKIDEIVFDSGIQNITGPKRFSQDVEVFGDMNTEFINGIPIQEEYDKSILLKESTDFNGSIVVLRPSYINGNIETESINGYPVPSIQEILNMSDTSDESREIHHYIDKIVAKIHRNIPNSQGLSREFMYLEKSDELQISVPDTVSATIISSKGYILLHITAKESSGDHCGLPTYCECPVQYALEISPERSVTTFPNKGSQRIFSYDDEMMMIHFITNSVSTSANCSTSKSKLMNEVSMMTWNTISTPNTTGQFYQYQRVFTGYISKVIYFTLNHITFAVIGRYYDPVLNSYDLDCTIMKFCEDRTNTTEIQKISTRGASELYVFHTAQGVVLVIGNSISSHDEDDHGETLLYRFNADNEQFYFLRSIPSFGCTKATGVVLGSDSFIILGHRIAEAQVIKYFPEYDNYYFYQSFDFDEPIIGISSFYAADYGVSDAYVAIVTGTNKYYIYSFEFLEGWKLISSGELEGIRNLIPFEVEQQSYLLAPSTKTSSLLTVVKN